MRRRVVHASSSWVLWCYDVVVSLLLRQADVDCVCGHIICFVFKKSQSRNSFLHLARIVGESGTSSFLQCPSRHYNQAAAGVAGALPHYYNHSSVVVDSSVLNHAREIPFDLPNFEC